METMKIRYEMTDLYCGEPNYGWVKRGFLTLPITASQHKIMRDAKEALGITGIPCRLEKMWNGWTLRPTRSCCIAWVTVEYDETSSPDA